MEALTVARALELLDYDPATGVFLWRAGANLRGKAKPGERAGCLDTNGYRQIGVEGKVYKAGRLAWFVTFGHWPCGHIDHRDHNTSNDAIANLRDVTVAVNAQNKIRAMSHSSSGFLGVFPLEGGKWGSKLVRMGVRHYFGRFATPEEAHAAYLVGKRAIHEGNTL